MIHHHYRQFPLPPIQQNWRAAADVTCVELARHFQSRISLWNSMVGGERQQGNNTADDAVNLDSP
jgi:hypothetical protein